MSIVDKLAEQQILAALERGEFNNLPGEGKPLELDDDSAIPEELRAAYRLLKNSGYLPPELLHRAEIKRIEQLLLRVASDHEKKSLLTKISLLKSRL